MLRFRRARLQMFASVHASVSNHFNVERHLYSRANFKRNRDVALNEWRGALCRLIAAGLGAFETGSSSSDSTLTGAILDRLTHHVHILEMNGESYRLNQSRKRKA